MFFPVQAIAHYQNEWETRSELATQSKNAAPLSTIVAVCAARYTAMVLPRHFCLSSLESCPSKRSRAPLRYRFGLSPPPVLVMANMGVSWFSRRAVIRQELAGYLCPSFCGPVFIPHLVLLVFSRMSFATSSLPGTEQSRRVRCHPAQTCPVRPQRPPGGGGVRQTMRLSPYQPTSTPRKYAFFAVQNDEFKGSI